MHRVDSLLEHRRYLGFLGCTDHVGSLTDGRGFLCSNGLKARAQMLVMVHADRRHSDQRPPTVGCGGIQSASQTCFQHEPVGPLRFEVNQCAADQLLERSEAALFRQWLQLLERLSQGRDRDQLVVDADAFTPTHQMGRRGKA